MYWRGASSPFGRVWGPLIIAYTTRYHLTVHSTQRYVDRLDLTVLGGDLRQTEIARNHSNFLLYFYCRPAALCCKPGIITPA